MEGRIEGMSGNEIEGMSGNERKDAGLDDDGWTRLTEGGCPARAET